MIVSTTSDAFLGVNSTVERLFGWASEEVVGTPAPYLFHCWDTPLDSLCVLDETWPLPSTVTRRPPGALVRMAERKGMRHDVNVAIIRPLGSLLHMLPARLRARAVRSESRRRDPNAVRLTPTQVPRGRA